MPSGGHVLAPGRDRERGAPERRSVLPHRDGRGTLHLDQKQERLLPRLLIAVALGGYGLYGALYVPAMLLGAPVPLLLVGFILQAFFGILAGIAVWRGARWAPLLVVLLGASIAATALLEGFAFGIVAYLRALLEAVAAITLTVLIAVYVKRGLGAPETTSIRMRRLG